MIDGTMYDTQLKNQKYDDQRCKGHAHVMQIRHGVNFSLAKSLHEAFSATWMNIKIKIDKHLKFVLVK